MTPLDYALGVTQAGWQAVAQPMRGSMFARVVPWG